MMYWAYNVLLILSGVFLLPYFLVQVIRSDRYRHGFWQRIGFVPPKLKRLGPGTNRIWIHAVSVGETLAAVPLVEAIQTRLPDCALVFSNTTVTGHNTALERLPDSVAKFYFPLDFPWGIRNFLRHVRPRLILVMETELWPNLFFEAHRLGIPLTLVNGRISDRSIRGYRKIRFFLKPVLRCGTLFLMQTPTDAERIRSLGAPPDRVEVVGNIKFEGLGEPLDPERVRGIRKEFGLRDGERVFLAGSTHPGEEEIVLSSYLRLKDRFTPLRLIVAPRRNERGEEVEHLVREKGLSAVRRSNRAGWKSAENGSPVIVLDTIGELGSLYSVADVVFVGGSLVNHGGHNILEPAVYKRPILFGPHMQNFKAIHREFLRRGAGIEIRNEEDLTRNVDLCLTDPRHAGEMGRRAFDYLNENKGALIRNLDRIQTLLEIPPKP